MAFELREHTADVAVAATGETLEAVFAAIAEGLTAAHSDDIPATGDRFALAVTAESPEAVLFEYLDELIYQRDVREVLPTDHRVSITTIDPGETGGDSWRLEATARGVPFDDIQAREIKAVTYSEMRLEETADGWEAYVVFDV